MRVDRRRLFVALMAVVALCLAAAAEGAEKRASVIPRPDPPDHWRILTLDEATSTSECIGRLITPLCTVETVMACLFQRRVPPCLAVFGNPWGSEEDHNRLRSKKLLDGRYLKYQVVEVRPFRLSDVPDHDRKSRKSIRRGDLMIRIQNIICIKEVCLDEGSDVEPPIKYCVRREGAGWKYCGWFCDDDKQDCFFI
ncbi:MAG: hypothetical protein HY246_05670 [Proteobacteria bacterium]|nr:hypothetical protein [Pseudomonadota bacterium]